MIGPGGVECGVGRYTLAVDPEIDGGRIVRWRIGAEGAKSRQSELGVIIQPEAAQVMAGQKQAGVLRATDQTNDRESPRSRRPITSESQGVRIEGRDPQAAVTVISPAATEVAEDSTVNQNTGVVSASGEAEDRPLFDEGNRVGGTGKFIVADVVGIANAELTEVIAAPTSNSIGVEERTGVVTGQGQGGRGSAKRNLGIGGRGQFVVTDVVGIAKAKLAEVIPAPATEGIVRKQGACAVAARGDQFGGRAERHLRYRRRGYLVVADVIGVTEAELSEVVASPTLHRSVGHQRAGMAVAGDKKSGLSPEADGAQLERMLGGKVFVRSEAELTAIVPTPAADAA